MFGFFKQLLIEGWAEKLMSLKVYMMSSYQLLMTFLTSGIQAFQYHLKKCVDRKGGYVKKQTSFCLILLEYLGWPMNFQGKPRISV